MTLQQFRSLPKNIQQETAKRSGVLLFTKTGVGVRVMLYQVDGFYVEIYFDDQLLRALRLRSFADTKPLDPYLRMIDVSEVQRWLKKIGN